MSNQPTLFETHVLPLFEEHREPWLSRARRVAAELGRAGRPVTVNDVRELCPPPKDQDPRVMGAVFVRSDWERVGYVSSDRRTCHGRAVAQFVRRH